MEKEEVKLKIQQEWIKYHLEGYQLKSMLEDVTEMGDLYEELDDKEMFYDSIQEVIDLVKEKYGLKERRRKGYEKLMDKIDEKFGPENIGNNINRLLNKNK